MGDRAVRLLVTVRVDAERPELCSLECCQHLRVLLHHRCTLFPQEMTSYTPLRMEGVHPIRCTACLTAEQDAKGGSDG